MIYKQVFSAKGAMSITFELPSGVWADRIHVVGDFNNWSKTETPMRQERDGMWRATIEVPLGQQYEFRYLIDGDWHTDYRADGSRSNLYGTENSVLDAVVSSDAEVDDEFAVGFSESVPEGGQIVRLTPRLLPLPRRRLAAAA